VSGFERLGPSVQHHIVNTLGWRALRPLQEQAIGPILDGESALLLAPTAGGKTEAALFPLLGRMTAEDWRPISVLYLCPIKALLNNLEHRLRDYTGWIGRSVGLWHGDVGQGARTRLIQERPDILLVTPESLEVMLTSTRTDPAALFANVAAVVVDEIHAFAGDDRGWHLLAVLDRVTRLGGRPIQRIGLSATVGNPDELLEWLTAGTGARTRVVAPTPAGASTPDIQIDHVGSLANAAIVISRLHAGEKRLVFCDSRSQAEALAGELRAHAVETFVSHSSLSADERRRAEGAFAEARNCVIVATSTLELGIDVGDLDRVIQIDAPSTVASFLQRLGRTGRRAGSSRNCLFLATTEEALMRVMGLVLLWERGFVEPIVPPALPYPVLAQQVMALCLQAGERGRLTWHEHLPAFLASARLEESDRHALVDEMIAREFLFEDDGLLGLGTGAEKAYGRRHWMALFSVFDSPPMFLVLHGRNELGNVHELSFRIRPKNGPTVLSLGGRSWKVRHIDWQRKQAFVEPSGHVGRSRWLGSGQGLGLEHCQSIKRALGGQLPSVKLSTRARDAMTTVVDDYDWVDEDTSALSTTDAGTSWWTFGGGLLNAALAARLTNLSAAVSHDSFAVHLGMVVNDYDPFGTVMHAGSLSLASHREAFRARRAAREERERRDAAAAERLRVQKATPKLANAVGRGDVAAVKALLERGADVAAVERETGSLVALARRNDRHRMMEFLSAPDNCALQVAGTE